MIFKLKELLQFAPCFIPLSGFASPGPVMLLEYHRIFQILCPDYNIWKRLFRTGILPLFGAL